jgi:hypothetical protein
VIKTVMFILSKMIFDKSWQSKPLRLKSINH